VSDQIYELERSVQRIALEARDRHAQLSRLGLDAKIDLLKQFHDGLLKAELRMSFLRGGDLVDALEALTGVTRKGSPRE
jgi:hypothetical protein